MEKQLDITCKAALLAAIMALAGLSLFAAATPSRDEVTITGRLHADTSDLEDAILVVELEQELCLRSVLLRNGRFEFKVPVGAHARLVFLKPGYLTKEVLVDTKNALVSAQANKINKTVKFDVVLESTEERKHQAYIGAVCYIDIVNGTGLMRVRHDERMVAVAQEVKDE